MGTRQRKAGPSASLGMTKRRGREKQVPTPLAKSASGFGATDGGDSSLAKDARRWCAAVFATLGMTMWEKGKMKAEGFFATLRMTTWEKEGRRPASEGGRSP